MMLANWVSLDTRADVTRIDAQLGKRLGAGRVIRQKLVAVVMKIADQRHIDTHALQLIADSRHRSRSILVIYSDTHEFRTGTDQLGDLDRSGDMIRRIGIGHRLHNDRRPGTDSHPPNPHGTGGTTSRGLPAAYFKIADRHNSLNLETRDRDTNVRDHVDLTSVVLEFHIAGVTDHQLERRLADYFLRRTLAPGSRKQHLAIGIPDLEPSLALEAEIRPIACSRFGRGFFLKRRGTAAGVVDTATP